MNLSHWAQITIRHVVHEVGRLHAHAADEALDALFEALEEVVDLTGYLESKGWRRDGK